MHVARRSRDSLFLLVDAVVRVDESGRVRKEEAAAALHRLGVLVPEGALCAELHAVVYKVYTPLQEQGTALAGDSKAVGVLHDQWRCLGGGACREERDKQQRQKPAQHITNRCAH